MHFYSIFRSIICRFPPSKLVPLVQVVEGGSKHSGFFTVIRWPLIHILLRNISIISDTVSSKNLVFLV